MHFLQMLIRKMDEIRWETCLSFFPMQRWYQCRILAYKSHETTCQEIDILLSSQLGKKKKRVPDYSLQPMLLYSVDSALQDEAFQIHQSWLHQISPCLYQTV